MLLIQITKRADGGGLLRCVRADGSFTWQKQESRHAAFFALHDLTHFAVETTLGFRRGFFGLVAEGWEIEETTGQEARGAIPDEAKAVEYIVGSLDGERASGAVWTADDFNRQAAIHAASASLPSPRPLTDEELTRVRARRAELFAKWRAIAPGEALELTYAFDTIEPRRSVMRRFATKDQILEDAGYAYSFDRAVYVNRHAKKAFSIEFVEDHTDEQIKARIDEYAGDGWRFYFNSDPSESVKGELERILG